ncbi:hypothetical protein NL676_007980 [Syzygium grande]|nr:hypothetical protein NL676_007980 [Syzygium grande]
MGGVLPVNGLQGLQRQEHGRDIKGSRGSHEHDMRLNCHRWRRRYELAGALRSGKGVKTDLETNPRLLGVHQSRWKPKWPVVSSDVTGVAGRQSRSFGLPDVADGADEGKLEEQRCCGKAWVLAEISRKTPQETVCTRTVNEGGSAGSP